MKKLYTSPISPNAKRVTICAAELGVSLEPTRVDFAKGEQRLPEYLALNPMGKIPTYVEGPLTLWESGAILWYLATTHRAGHALPPDDVLAQADTMRWLFFCSCHIDPPFTTLVGERFIKARRGSPEDVGLTAAAERDLGRFVPVLEQQLDGRDYVTGTFSIADIALGCTLEMSPVVRYDLAPYPRVRAWLDRLQARDSWRSATVPAETPAMVTA